MRPCRGGLQPLRPAPCVTAVAAFHAAVGVASLRLTRVGASWITTRASRPSRIGDTIPLCPVAHASVVWPGVSIAHISDDKALVLCQGAYHTFFVSHLKDRIIPSKVSKRMRGNDFMRCSWA